MDIQSLVKWKRQPLFVAIGVLLLSWAPSPTLSQSMSGFGDDYTPPRSRPAYNPQAFNNYMRNMNALNNQTMRQMQQNIRQGQQMAEAIGRSQQRRAFQSAPRQQYQPRRTQQYQPRQQQYQPRPTQQRYVKPSSPQYTTPKPAVVPVPKNTIPAQVPPNSLALAQSNPMVAADYFPDLPADRIDPLTGELNDQLRGDFEAFDSAFQKSIVEDFFANPYNGFAADLSPDVVNALKQGDFDQAKQFLANSGINGPDLLAKLEVIDQLEEVTRLASDLEKGLQAGLSADQLQGTITDLRDKLAASGYETPDSPHRQEASRHLDSIEISLQIEEELYVGPPSSPLQWDWLSDTPRLVIFDPSIPAGDYYRAGANTIVVYSDEGHFHTARQPLADAIALPLGVSSPALPPISDQSTDNTLLLRNPEDNGTSIAFQVNGKNYTIEPGEEESIVIRGSEVVTYDTGASKSRSYTVNEGAYNFRLGDDGWNFYKADFKVVINNESGAIDFQLVADGEQKTIQAGSSLELAGSFPVVVTFDRGAGGKPVKRRLETGEYYVAIDREAGAWDLFDKVTTGGAASDGLVVQPSAEPRAARSLRPRWGDNS